MGEFMNNYSKYGVTKNYWESLTVEDQLLFEKINPFLRQDDECYHVKASNLKRELDFMAETAKKNGGSFNLTPDYQRDNVRWDQKQKIAFVENLVRNIAPVELKFNTDKDNNVTCIDGVQRITAIIDFIEGKFLVFGDLSFNELAKKRFSIARRNLVFKLYNFEEKIDLYYFYLSLNEGGTHHSKADLDKVKKLIEIEENLI